MNFKDQTTINLKIFLSFPLKKKTILFEKTNSGLVIYKTKGHCWDVPSPCVQSMGELSLKTVKTNGYYFIMKKIRYC